MVIALTGEFRFFSIPRGLERLTFAPLAKVATSSYYLLMRMVSIKDAKNRLTALARLVEKGETVVVTRSGKPVFDLVPHRTKNGLKLSAVKEFKRKHRITSTITHVADDFDAPLPEDILIRPLP
jgi:prevent-host-death family protein